jgi:hypothetical protein
MVAKVSNNASTLVPGSVTSTATSIVVTTGDGAKFPALGAGDFFFLTITDTGGNFEIVKVTARADDTFTVVRAQSGTLAIPFPANSRAELRVTAENISIENQNVLLL